MAGVGHLQLGRVLLKVESSLTDKVDWVPKVYWLAVPVVDPEVCVVRWPGGLETRHPVTGTRQRVDGLPGPVPLAAHADLSHVALGCLELAARATGVPGMGI